MQTVLIADKLPDVARTRLQAAGFIVESLPSASAEALTEALRRHDPDVLVVRSTRVTAAHFAAARGLQLVVRAGAGFDNIDLAAASARGVFVSTCPGMNAVAVAELTFAHLLNADRGLADQVTELRAGQWRKKHHGRTGHGLKGRTLGVLGVGAIGQAVIARARAFELQVLAWSPRFTDEDAARLGVRRCASAVEVARLSDALTVHLALTPATRGFVGEAILSALRPGAIFVNTSRGEVVDEAALAAAVQERGLRVGLDVFADEPADDGAFRPAIAELPGVYGSHHIAASTAQAQEAVAAAVCQTIERWGHTGQAPHCVNLAAETPATHLLVVRHADEVGVLAAVLDTLREARINVQGMENIIFAGDEGAACARIQVEGTPDVTLLERLTTIEHVIAVKVVALSPGRGPR